MSKFKEFMDEAEESPTRSLPSFDKSISAIQVSLTLAVGSLLAPLVTPSDKKQKFAEEVSNLVRDKAFISEFSDCMGEPSELETENEFVERGSDVLRRMLYDRFGIEG
ncbi:MAG TPA: hypothetical protein VL134_09945 [Leptolyngbya sp.]|jgi:hypothetical protein|nr:hypothetical protein [Leptolyngbya sp.]